MRALEPLTVRWHTFMIAGRHCLRCGLVGLGLVLSWTIGAEAQTAFGWVGGSGPQTNRQFEFTANVDLTRSRTVVAAFVETTRPAVFTLEPTNRFALLDENLGAVTFRGSFLQFPASPPTLVLRATPLAGGEAIVANITVSRSVDPRLVGPEPNIHLLRYGEREENRKVMTKAGENGTESLTDNFGSSVTGESDINITKLRCDEHGDNQRSHFFGEVRLTAGNRMTLDARSGYGMTHYHHGGINVNAFVHPTTGERNDDGFGQVWCVYEVMRTASASDSLVEREWGILELRVRSRQVFSDALKPLGDNQHFRDFQPATSISRGVAFGMSGYEINPSPLAFRINLACGSNNYTFVGNAGRQEWVYRWPSPEAAGTTCNITFARLDVQAFDAYVLDNGPSAELEPSGILHAIRSTLPPSASRGINSNSGVTYRTTVSPETAVLLSTSPTTVREGDAPVTVTVTATAAPVSAAEDIVVDIDVPDGDTYTIDASSTFAITIPMNETNATNTFQLTPTDNNRAGRDETIELTGTATPERQVTPATFTIRNNDLFAVEVVGPAEPLAPDATATFTVRLANGKVPAEAIDVEYAISGVSNDQYEDENQGRVELPANSTGVSIPIELTAAYAATLRRQGIPVTLTATTLRVGATRLTDVTMNAATAIFDPITNPVAIAYTDGAVREDAADPSFTITLAETPAVQVTVMWALDVSDPANTVTAADITSSASGSHMFPANATGTDLRHSFTVTLAEDSLLEVDETMVLALAFPDDAPAGIGADVNASRVAVTIIDADTGELSITGGGSYTEGDAAVPNLAFTVSSTTMAGSDIAIRWQASGTAATAEDLAQTSGTIIIATGTTSAMLTIPIRNDDIVEMGESVTITLTELTDTSPPGATIDLAAAAATAILADDDGVMVTLTASATQAIEGGDAVEAVVSLSTAAPAGGIVIPLTATNGTQADDADWTGPDPLTVTIPADQRAAAIAIRANPDTVWEVGDGEIVTIGLGMLPADYVPHATENTVQIELVDGGSLPIVTSSLTVAGDGALSEADTTVTATLTVTVDASAIRFAEDRTFTVTTPVGGAQLGQDFRMSAPAVVIPAGAATGIPEITVTILNDEIVEGDEELALVLTVDGPRPTEVIFRQPGVPDIADDDTATLAFISPPPGNLSEGSPVLLELQLTKTIAAPLTVPWMFASVSTSFTAGDLASSPGNFLSELTGHTVIIAANRPPSATTTIDLWVQEETRNESTAEVVTVSLGTPTGDVSDSVTLDSSNSSREFTIVGSDQRTSGGIVVSFGTTEHTVAEGGSRTIMITVSGDRVPEGNANIPLTVAYTGGASMSDFTVPTSATLTRGTGSTDTGSIAVRVDDDAFWDGDQQETVTIRFGNLSNSYSIGTNASVAIIAIDADSAPSFTGTLTATGDGDLEEANVGKTATLAIAISGTASLDQERTLTIADASGGATLNEDFVLSATSVTVPAGSTAWAASVTVTVLDDAVVEGPEELGLELSLDVVDANAVTISQPTALTIADNDTATIGFAAGTETGSVTEGDRVALTVQVSHAVAAAVTVPWQVTGTNVTAADVSLASLTGHDLTFPADMPAGTSRVITFTIERDNVPEGDEALTVELLAPTSTLTTSVSLNTPQATRTRTITANGNSIALAATAGQLTEGDRGDANDVTAEFTVTLGRALAEAVNVHYAVDAGNSSVTASDFAPAAVWDSGSVHIAAGMTTATFTAALAADDIVEAAEVYVVHLTAVRSRNTDGTDGAAVPGFTFGADTRAAVTIADDDSATVAITQAPASAAEGTSVNVQITLSAAVADAVTVPVTLAGTGFTASDVNPGSTAGAVTFAAGSTAGAMQNFTFTVVQDHLAEPAETWTVALGRPTGALAGRVTLGTDAERMIEVPASVAELSVTVGIAGSERRTVTEGEAAEVISLIFEPATQVAFETAILLRGSDAHTDSTDLPWTEITSELQIAGLGVAARPQVNHFNQTLRYDVAVPAGVQRFDIQVTALSDTRWEAGRDEVVALELDAAALPSGARQSTTERGLVLIEIADATTPPALTLMLNRTSVNESGSAAERAVSVSVTVVSGADVTTREGDRTVELTITPGPGVTAEDYTATAPHTISLPASGASGTYSFVIADDSLAEADETITIAADVLGATIAPATVTIVDDDRAAQPIIELSVTSTAPSAPDESDTVTVNLEAATADGSNVTTTTEVTVSVGLSPADATAQVNPTTATISIAGDASSGTGSLTVTLTDDRQAEPDVTVGLTGTATGYVVRGTSFTIVDDDEVVVELAPAPATFAKSGALTYTVRVADAAVVRTAPVVVDFTYVGSAIAGGVDFAFATATHAERRAQLTIPTAGSSANITFNVAPRPNRKSGQNVGIRLTAATGTGRVRLGDEVVRYTQLDESAPPRVQRIWLTSQPINPFVGYEADDDIQASVQFDQPISITGGTATENLAVLKVDIGGTLRDMVQSGTVGDRIVTFTYTVVAGADADGNGLAIPADAYRLRGMGAVRATGAGGVAAELSHPAVMPDPGQLVAGGTIAVTTATAQVNEGAATPLRITVQPPYTGTAPVELRGLATGAVLDFELGALGDATLRNETRAANMLAGREVRITLRPGAATAFLDFRAVADGVWETGTAAEETVTVTLQADSTPPGYRLVTGEVTSTVTVVNTTPAPQLQLWVQRRFLAEGERPSPEQSSAFGANLLGNQGQTDFRIVTAPGSSVAAEALDIQIALTGDATIDPQATADYFLHNPISADPTYTTSLTLTLPAQATESTAGRLNLVYDSRDESDERIVMTPSLAGFTIDPVTVTILDRPADADTFAVTDVLITTAPADGFVYRTGENILVELLVNQTVRLRSTADARPTLTLTFGDAPAERRTATLFQQTGEWFGIRIPFRYTVQAGDLSTAGIGVLMDSLTVPSGAGIEQITVGAGDTVVATGNFITTNPALVADPEHQVLGTDAPSLMWDATQLAFTSTPSNGEGYLPGEMVELTLTFNVPVFVDRDYETFGVAIPIGPMNRTADYVRGSGTTELVFAMTVMENDWNDTGLEVPADSFHFAGPTELPIRDQYGTPMEARHNALAVQSAHKIHGRSISFRTAAASVREGASISIAVEFRPAAESGDLAETIPVTAQLTGQATAADWTIDVDASTNFTLGASGTYLMSNSAAEAILVFEAATDNIWESGVAQGVTLQLGALPTDYRYGPHRSVAVTITDQTAPPTFAQVTLSAESVSEDAATARELQADVQLALAAAGSLIAGDREVTFAVDASSTAKLGTDFTVPDPFTATLRDRRRRSGAATITMLNDAIIEGRETIVLTATITDLPVASLQIADGQLDITETDTVTAAIAGPSAINEGETAAYTVTTDANLGDHDLTLPVVLTGTGIAATDFVDAPILLRIPAGSVPGEFTLPIEVSDGDGHEGAETFTVALATPATGPLVGRAATTPGAGVQTEIAANTLQDPTAGRITVSEANLWEADTSLTAEVAVHLQGGAYADERTVTVALSPTSTATIDEDFTVSVTGQSTAGGPWTITIPMETSTGSTTLTVTVIDDDVFTELLRESIVLTATVAGANAVTFDNQTITVSSDDSLTVDISGDGSITAEDGLILYHALQHTNLLGRGASGEGEPAFRQTFLGPYLRDNADSDIRALLTAIHAAAESEAESPLDVDGDDDVDATDGLLWYYALAFPDLLGEGGEPTGDGFVTFRQDLIGIHLVDGTDATARELIRAIRALAPGN